MCCKKGDMTPVPQDEETGVRPHQPVTGFGNSFSDKTVRTKFIRKVYGLLLTQLVFTTILVTVFIVTPGFKEFYCSTVEPDPDVRFIITEHMYDIDKYNHGHLLYSLFYRTKRFSFLKWLIQHLSFL